MRLSTEADATCGEAIYTDDCSGEVTEHPVHGLLCETHREADEDS